MDFDAKDRWPEFRPPGWTGDLQYSLGMAMRLEGTWHVSAPIEFWRGLPAHGGAIYAEDQVRRNWFYDTNRWGPMCRQPAPGELVGFFVVAADGRGSEFGVAERSNVVVVPFPSGPGVLL